VLPAGVPPLSTTATSLRTALPALYSPAPFSRLIAPRVIMKPDSTTSTSTSIRITRWARPPLSSSRSLPGPRISTSSATTNSAVVAISTAPPAVRAGSKVMMSVSVALPAGASKTAWFVLAASSASRNVTRPSAATSSARLSTTYAVPLSSNRGSSVSRWEHKEGPTARRIVSVMTNPFRGRNAKAGAHRESHRKASRSVCSAWHHQRPRLAAPHGRFPPSLLLVTMILLRLIRICQGE